MQSKTSKLQMPAKIGLKMNVKKTEVMSLNTKLPLRIQVDGNNLMNKILSHALEALLHVQVMVVPKKTSRRDKGKQETLSLG